MAQWQAGERITATKLSTLAGDDVVRVVNSAAFTTTETVVDTITVPLVSGDRYKIVWEGQFFSSVADGYLRCRLREDSVTGTVIQLRQLYTATVAGQSFALHMEMFYTASATANKTFVATAIRQAGTGSITALGAGDSSALMYVENIG